MLRNSSFRNWNKLWLDHEGGGKLGIKVVYSTGTYNAGLFLIFSVRDSSSPHFVDVVSIFGTFSASHNVLVTSHMCVTALVSEGKALVLLNYLRRRPPQHLQYLHFHFSPIITFSTLSSLSSHHHTPAFEHLHVPWILFSLSLFHRPSLISAILTHSRASSQVLSYILTRSHTFAHSVYPNTQKVTLVFLFVYSSAL